MNNWAWILLLSASLSHMLGGCGAASLNVSATAVAPTDVTLNNLLTLTSKAFEEQAEAFTFHDLTTAIRQGGTAVSEVGINKKSPGAKALATLLSLGCYLATIVALLPITVVLLIGALCNCPNEECCPGCTCCGDPTKLFYLAFLLWALAFKGACGDVTTLLKMIIDAMMDATHTT